MICRSKVRKKHANVRCFGTKRRLKCRDVLDIKIKSPANSIRLEIFGEFVLFVFRPDTLGKFYPPLLFVDLLTIFYDFCPALAFARTQRIKSVNN